jgi:hypothetical protein
MRLDRAATAVTPLAVRCASRSVHSLGAQRGKRRAGCLGHPWPASVSRALRTNTLGVLPRACARPRCARAGWPAQARQLTPRGGVRSRTFALRPCYTTRRFAQCAARIVRSRAGVSWIEAPCSLAAKPALCKMAAAASWESAHCARVVRCRFGCVLAARL